MYHGHIPGDPDQNCMQITSQYLFQSTFLFKTLIVLTMQESSTL